MVFRLLQQYQEETHTNIGRTCKLHSVRPQQGGNCASHCTTVPPFIKIERNIYTFKNETNNSIADKSVIPILHAYNNMLPNIMHLCMDYSYTKCLIE